MKRTVLVLFAQILALTICAREQILDGVQTLAMFTDKNDNLSLAAAEPAFTFEVWGEIPNAEPDVPEKHELGTEITRKWNTFLKNYTREYCVSVGLTDSGYEFLKPAVFNAVKRANRYVKKCIRKGDMSRENAVAVMGHVLDCANTIIFENDTEKFEEAASRAMTGKDAVGLFESVKLIQR